MHTISQALQFALRGAHVFELLVVLRALVQAGERVDQLLLQAHALGAKDFVFFAGALDAVGDAGEAFLHA